MSSSLSDLHVGSLLPSTVALVAAHGALALGMAAVLFLLPAAFYFAIRRDSN
jgi:hypothetical protein